MTNVSDCAIYIRNMYFALRTGIAYVLLAVSCLPAASSILTGMPFVIDAFDHLHTEGSLSSFNQDQLAIVNRHCHTTLRTERAKIDV